MGRILGVAIAAFVLGIAAPVNAAVYLLTLSGSFSGFAEVDTANTLLYNENGALVADSNSNLAVGFLADQFDGGLFLAELPDTLLFQATGPQLFVTGAPTLTLRIGTFDLAGTAATPSYFQLVIRQVGGAVPEPGAWALLIAGFGVIGAGMRGARRQTGQLSPSF